MAVSIIECLDSRGQTIDKVNGEATLRYKVLGTMSSVAVRTIVFNTAPTIYERLIRSNVNVSVQSWNIWQAEVRYRGVENKVQISIDSSPEKIKKTRSIRNISNWNLSDISTRGVTGPDFKGLINVGKDKVEGTDFFERGAFKLHLNWSSDWSYIRPDYIQQILDMGVVQNDSPVILEYKGQEITFNRGVLLFLGAKFNESSDQASSISMDFEGRLGEIITIGERTGETLATTTGDIDGSEFISSVADTDGIAPGMDVAGDGIPSGTTVVAVEPDTDVIELSNDATDVAVARSFTFSWAPIAKEGWEYAWVRTEKVRDATLGIEIERPKSLHLEQMAEYEDFSKLEVFDVIRDGLELEDELPDDADEVD